MHAQLTSTLDTWSNQSRPLRCCTGLETYRFLDRVRASAEGADCYRRARRLCEGGEVKADVANCDRTDGRMIWQHNIKKAGGTFSSPDALRKRCGRGPCEGVPVNEEMEGPVATSTQGEETRFESST